MKHRSFACSYLVLSLLLILLPLTGGCNDRSGMEKTVPYELVSRTDITVGGVKTTAFRIVVNPGLSDEELLEVFSLVDDRAYDEVTAWFYKDKAIMLSSRSSPLAVIKRETRDGPVLLER